MRGILRWMSRLRRLVLSDLYFFITGRVIPYRRMLDESEFECLARVVRERRRKHGFLLTAWVFLPDHWHAISTRPTHSPSRGRWSPSRWGRPCESMAGEGRRGICGNRAFSTAPYAQ